MSNMQSCVDKLVDTVRHTLAERRCWPESTYRLQFDPKQLTFRDAAALVPYLEQLGISHIYASPYLMAHSGSPHGYDVVDPSHLNPELGSPEDFAALVAGLHRVGMGQILDIVPNHMGICATENAWWNNVLENGPSSPYAHYFDIDWHPVKAELENKILLPMLEDQYGKVLEAGRLQLEYHEGAFVLRYFDHRLPLDPRTYATLLIERLNELKESLGPESEELRELESILTALEYLPTHEETNPERVTERQREKEVIKGRLRRLTDRSPAIARFVERNMHDFNGSTDDPRSFDRLDNLLNAQVYRLSHWKAAADEINYRRFFDINELAAVATEDPQVFEDIHRLIFELLVRGDVDGLRIDHIDGLYDPLDYLRRLQQGYVRALGRMVHQRWRDQAELPHREPGEPEAPAELPPWEEVEPRFLRRTADDLVDVHKAPLYVLVEKILGPEEPLPNDWPVAGTTGYDVLNLVNRLLVEPAGWTDLINTYQRFVNERGEFREVAYRAKLLILRVSMASDLQLLAHRLNRISERHRRCRDFTLNTLRIALREILASFPVYRTYIREGHVSDQDRQFILRAVAQAKRRNPPMNPAVFDFIRDVLFLEQPPGLDEAGRRERELFVGRFQQVTSPLVAKGVEDTAFYDYFPLASLNEVGGDPTKAALSLDEFHRDNASRRTRQPRSLIATTTHDTKRTEDVRARINVLSEIPRLWRAAVNRWGRLNKRHRREVDGLPAPSRNDEYLLYQTLVGVWPLEILDKEAYQGFIARIQGYMEKATHEAKQRTSWINPNAEYDGAVRDFVTAVLTEHRKNRFLVELCAFHERIVQWGLYSALSQTFLKLTVPGIPDIYQGQELWDFSLVDPDNRRPVDFVRRADLLRQLQADVAPGSDALRAVAGQLARNPSDPRLKLFVTWQTLQFRRRHAELFRCGQYVPLSADGSRADHVCSFAWRSAASAGPSDQVAIVIAPRLLARLAARSDAGPTNSGPLLGAAAWGNSQLSLGDLPHRPLKNIFTGEVFESATSVLPLSAVLSEFPVALLTNVETADAR